MKNILEDLEILILQNEDDFDRGSGKFILRNFIKEKKSEQLTLTDVSQQRELLEGFVDWFNINDKTQAILSERIEEYLKTL